MVGTVRTEESRKPRPSGRGFHNPSLVIPLSSFRACGLPGNRSVAMPVAIARAGCRPDPPEAAMLQGRETVLDTTYSPGYETATLMFATWPRWRVPVGRCLLTPLLAYAENAAGEARSPASWCGEADRGSFHTASIRPNAVGRCLCAVHPEMGCRSPVARLLSVDGPRWGHSCFGPAKRSARTAVVFDSEGKEAVYVRPVRRV